MTEKVKLTIRKSVDSEMMLGGLRFEACRREIEKVDGGITLRVFLAGQAISEESRWPELLRFDCFRGAPHYHAPGENRAETKIDSELHGDGTAWVIDQLATNMPDFMDQAGFASETSQIDLDALKGLPDRLRELFDSLAKPTEVSYFEVDEAELGGLAAELKAAG